jgi:hypothetical protein
MTLRLGESFYTVAGEVGVASSSEGLASQLKALKIRTGPPGA